MVLPSSGPQFLVLATSVPLQQHAAVDRHQKVHLDLHLAEVPLHPLISVMSGSPPGEGVKHTMPTEVIETAVEQPNRQDTDLTSNSPRWARPALAVITLVATASYAWHLFDRGFTPYYSMVVRAMSTSWRAFFYGALDPAAATTTMDKLPGFLWPQALSARIFGFHAWALILPGIVEGLITLLVLHALVRRWAGPIPAIAAAGIFALTPITASLFGLSGDDGTLIMCLVLAAYACQRAIESGRLNWLLLAGGWVGVGFQVKMAQAWVVLPAFALAYLVAAPLRNRTKWAQLSLAGLLTLVVSCSWTLAVWLIPAGDRPYIDGTTNNDPFSMVFVYNGLARFGGLIADPTKLGSAPTTGGKIASLMTMGGGGAEGPGKLFSTTYASQIGWLYVLAAVSLVAGLWWRPRLRAGYLMFGGWLLITMLAFSAGAVAHTNYMAALAPPLAAICGAGVVQLVEMYRAGRQGWWLLPATVAVSTAWADYLISQYLSFQPWLLLVVTALGVAAVLVLISRRLPKFGVIAAVTAMLLAPATWAASVVDLRYAGTPLNAEAGPAQSDAQVARLRGADDMALLAELLASGANGDDQRFVLAALLGATDQLTPYQQALQGYLAAHRNGAKFLFATDLWTQASPYLLAKGDEVLTLGGFSQDTPYPTLPMFQRMVSSGQVRYVMFGSAEVSTKSEKQAAVDQINQWVRSTCHAVPESDYLGSAPATKQDELTAMHVFECTA